MGLLDFLFGKRLRAKVEVIPDLMWITAEGKYAGLEREIEERSGSQTVAVLLVAHFADVLARLEEIASRQKSEVPIKSVIASDLNSSLAASLQFSESATIDILVGERHPIRTVDDQLHDFADKLPCRCRFMHFVSLEDAIVKTFAGDSVAQTLKLLGMRDDQAIQHRMVYRRIRSAQKRIQGKVVGSLEASSAEEWFSKNCPDGTGS